jgi:hypothetical protein
VVGSAQVLGWAGRERRHPDWKATYAYNLAVDCDSTTDE